MKVQHSAYLQSIKPVLKELLSELLKVYPYASILAQDSTGYRYSVNNKQTGITQHPVYTNCGFVIKVYDSKAYGEYSFNEVSKELIPDILKKVAETLKLESAVGDGLSLCEYKQMTDEPCIFSESTEAEVLPEDLGDEKIIAKLTGLKDKIMSYSSEIIVGAAVIGYQKYTKLFLSANKDMEQSIMWCEGYVIATSKRGEEMHDNYECFSNQGGFELLDKMDSRVEECCRVAVELLDAEPVKPGVYDCICTPEVTGMIVHEAFGHGVEMDMFVKDRALAKEYIGKRVASDLVTMHDCGYADIRQPGGFFFDDEGVLSHDTIIIKNGILQTGMSDAQSAMFLGTEPTGNGKRESYKRKAYTRMTNTYFEKGNDKVEDMIASIKDGLLLDHPTSGMEDPKNWGIQAMVDVAREIKDGKLTGKVFSPCILSGYVPDLLESITMMSDEVELAGSGACGKGYKEWVKVSDGGPYIKAKVRLG